MDRKELKSSDDESAASNALSAIGPAQSVLAALDSSGYRLSPETRLELLRTAETHLTRARLFLEMRISALTAAGVKAPVNDEDDNNPSDAHRQASMSSAGKSSIQSGKVVEEV